MAAHMDFGQLEAALAHILQVAEHKRVTFQSRLKQWQKMGFPADIRVGRGTKVKYSAEHLFQITVMSQLLRLGLTPERSIRMVNAGWPRFRQGLLEAMDHIAEDHPVITYAVVHVNALAELGWGDRKFENTIGVDITNDSELTALFYGINEADPEDEAAVKAEEEERGYSSDAWVEALRMAISDSIVLDLNILVIAVTAAVAQVLDIDPALFADEIADWREAHEAWSETDECKALMEADWRVLKRDTESPPWRKSAMPFAKFLVCLLTGRDAETPDGRKIVHPSKVAAELMKEPGAADVDA